MSAITGTGATAAAAAAAAVALLNAYVSINSEGDELLMHDTTLVDEAIDNEELDDVFDSTTQQRKAEGTWDKYDKTTTRMAAAINKN